MDGPGTIRWWSIRLNGLVSISNANAKEEVAMSPISSVDEAPRISPRSLQPRTWAGFAQGAERATHYLHLSAFPCDQCKGPVIRGWIGTREDDIARETGINEDGAGCISRGRRPES